VIKKLKNKNYTIIEELKHSFFPFSLFCPSTRNEGIWGLHLATIMEHIRGSGFFSTVKKIKHVDLAEEI